MYMILLIMLLLLHDSGTVRIGYSGYSGGFTAILNSHLLREHRTGMFMVLKGCGMAYFGYGDTTHHDSNVINVHFPIYLQQLLLRLHKVQN